jgi:predicted protein tyrosine phosphatase
LRSANVINCTTSSPPGVWDAAPAETELLVHAYRLVGGSDAVLVIDDTAIPKKGTHSVVSLRNMLRRSARPATARPLYR